MGCHLHLLHTLILHIMKAWWVVKPETCGNAKILVWKSETETKRILDSKTGRNTQKWDWIWRFQDRTESYRNPRFCRYSRTCIIPYPLWQLFIESFVLRRSWKTCNKINLKWKPIKYLDILKPFWLILELDLYLTSPPNSWRSISFQIFDAAALK